MFCVLFYKQCRVLNGLTLFQEVEPDDIVELPRRYRPFDSIIVTVNRDDPNQPMQITLELIGCFKRQGTG